ncbi:unnamed protein product [Ilex paraguariensis]|uniref:DCD domain-containing protein n=1 Tax=Ilex paraguariensis TaxID=185542 RepID=A0ABC8V1D6_9AQUA
MKYEEEDNGAAGRVPEFGAIFMANTATKRECFRRKFFGLPSSLANFVKQVKAGMILFLFEFEKRELFGVYRACCDGAMNLVPNAFNSVGKQFPAQVIFTPIWYCSPLSEHEFRDAIRDNYFSTKKFNFGLSEDQVRKLLWLCNSRKLNTKLPRRQLTRKISRLPGRRLADDYRFALNDGMEIEYDEGDYFGPACWHEGPVNSLKTAKIMDDHMVENEHKDSRILKIGVAITVILVHTDLNMKYEEEDNGAAGRVPEFGAIFMANTATKRECFRRKFFGLPSSLANFVKQVKAGMILFLFEFEKRELFGVYRACCDGAMNLVPNAFNSVGKQFPAQVIFTPIWYCSPLSEHEFRDAIRDNYFSTKKFNFGLSEDQVRKLLWLCNSRKLNTKLPRRQLTRKISRLPGRRLADDYRFALNDGMEIEYDEGDYFGPACWHEGPVNSLETAKIMDDHMVENEHKVDNCLGQDFLTDDYPSDTLGQRKRIDNDGRCLITDVTKNEQYSDHGPGQAFLGEYIGDSFGKVRRVADDDQILTGDRVESVCAMDNTFGPDVHTEYPGNSVGRARRIDEHGRFLMRESLGNECNLGSGSGLVIADEHLGKPLSKVKLAYDGSVSVNDSVNNECTMASCLKPVSPTEYVGIRRTTDADFALMNDRLQTEHHADSGIGPVKPTEQLSNRLGRIRRPIDDDRFLMSERVETKLSEHFWNHLGEGRRASNDERFSIRNIIENQHHAGNNFDFAVSSECSAYALGEVRQVADDGRFTKSDYGHVDNYIEPFSKQKMETAYSLQRDKRRDSSMFARPTEPQTFDFSYPSSHDAIVTGASPYGAGTPSECPPYHGSEGNILSLHKSRTSPYHRQPKGLSECLDVASGYGSKLQVPTTISHHDYSGSLTSKSCTNPGYAGNMELNTSAHDGYGGSLFSEPSLVSVPFSKGEFFEKENRGHLSYTGFSKNQSFELDNEYRVVPEGKYESNYSRHENNDGFAAKGLPSSAANLSHLGIYSHENDLINQGNAFYRISEGRHPDSKDKRPSVFARLSSATGVHVQEQQENDPQVVCDGHMDASVDEVMEMLYECQNHQVRKLRKFKPVLKQHDDDEIARNYEQTIKKHVDYDHLTMKNLRTKMDPYRAFEENGNQMLKETRAVDFKRRSETKKNLDETSTKGSVGVAEGKAFLGKQSKRRKLVRPVFDDKDSCNEGINCDGAQG